MVESKYKNNRILIEASLKPIQGNRFQPTGFPDLGAGEYQLDNGTYSLIVDSPQAVINHLERHCLDANEEKFVDALDGLSIVHVKDDKGKYLTNSVREGHRLNSPYILGGKERTEVGKAFDEIDTKSKPLEVRKTIIDTIFKYDINSLLHGVWFSQVGEGRIKFARALSAFVEADNARTAVYGGVKRDHVTTSTSNKKDSSAKTNDKSDAGNNEDEVEVKDASSGHGSIPFHRVEYTAEKITAFFNLDLEQLQSYELEENEKDLLETLALWKIRRFLDAPFRPRTACDLVMVGDYTVTGPENFDLPSISELDKTMKDLIAKCKDKMSQTVVTYKG